MKIIFKLVVICSLILLVASPVYAGWFGMSSAKKNTEKKEPVVQNQGQGMANEIPILDTIDKLILKRKEEAHKLIDEGKQLIKKGKNRQRQDLITKGQIKKEIGEKQLLILKEQADSKKKQDESDEW